MSSDDLATLTRRDKLRWHRCWSSHCSRVALWVSAQFLQPAPAAPHRARVGRGLRPLSPVRASATSRCLARDGVVVEERMTEGAAENLRLLLDPKSGVRRRVHAGRHRRSRAGRRRGDAGEPRITSRCGSSIVTPQTLTQLNQLQGKRIAVGRRRQRYARVRRAAARIQCRACRTIRRWSAVGGEAARSRAAGGRGRCRAARRRRADARSSSRRCATPRSS